MSEQADGRAGEVTGREARRPGGWGGLRGYLERRSPMELVREYRVALEVVGPRPRGLGEVHDPTFLELAAVRLLDELADHSEVFEVACPRCAQPRFFIATIADVASCSSPDAYSDIPRCPCAVLAAAGATTPSGARATDGR